MVSPVAVSFLHPNQAALAATATPGDGPVTRRYTDVMRAWFKRTAAEGETIRRQRAAIRQALPWSAVTDRTKPLTLPHYRVDVAARLRERPIASGSRQVLRLQQRHNGGNHPAIAEAENPRSNLQGRRLAQSSRL